MMALEGRSRVIRIYWQPMKTLRSLVLVLILGSIAFLLYSFFRPQPEEAGTVPEQHSTEEIIEHVS